MLFYIGFLEVAWIDILDVLLVSYLFYQFYKLISGSVAIRIFVGVISIYLFYLIVRALDMELLTSILGQFIGVGFIAAIIVFQQEIRRFLLMVGRTTDFNERFFKNLFRIKTKNYAHSLSLVPIIEAVKALSGQNTGALIVFAKTSELKFYAESGDEIDAVISKRILTSIFFKNNPLHDGAVIITNGRIKAARCVLPVSEGELPANFGLRHRAALGMSEATDAIVLIVSEETGQIAIAHSGILDSNLSYIELRQRLQQYLQEDEPEAEVAGSPSSASSADVALPA